MTILRTTDVVALTGLSRSTLWRLERLHLFAVRQLYSDQDEVLFEATRPIILNGIEDIVSRPDLADRALFLTLEPIPEERRRPEAELWDKFDTECPRVLGVLLDAVVEGLKRLPETQLTKLPRMADFARWGVACEPTFWPTGTFIKAYGNNLEAAVDRVIEDDPVASAVRIFMSTRTEWNGNAAELLDELEKAADELIEKSNKWPSSPRALSGRVRRAATFLRKIRINIREPTPEGHDRKRVIRITTAPSSPLPESAEDESFSSSASSALIDGSTSAPAESQTTHIAAQPSPASNVAIIPSANDADDADARHPTNSSE